MKQTTQMTHSEYLLYCIDRLNGSILNTDYAGIAEWASDITAVIREIDSEIDLM